mmetsp:Transcript_35361/g.57882  ORF Transcript_35361/g.57882 Transcript_35361/m.57882 type:complete len:208 (-) Transcript_35361:928-1551(-)
MLRRHQRNLSPTHHIKSSTFRKASQRQLQRFLNRQRHCQFAPLGRPLHIDAILFCKLATMLERLVVVALHADANLGRHLGVLCQPLSPQLRLRNSIVGHEQNTNLDVLVTIRKQRSVLWSLLHRTCCAQIMCAVVRMRLAMIANEHKLVGIDDSGTRRALHVLATLFVVKLILVVVAAPLYIEIICRLRRTSSSSSTALLPIVVFRF